MALVSYGGFGRFELDYDSDIVEMLNGNSNCLICKGPCEHDTISGHVDDVPMNVCLAETSAQINGDPIQRVAGFDYVSIYRKNRSNYAYVWPIILECLRTGRDIDVFYDSLQVIGHPIVKLPWSILILTAISIREVSSVPTGHGNEHALVMTSNARNVTMEIASHESEIASTLPAKVELIEPSDNDRYVMPSEALYA